MPPTKKPTIHFEERRQERINKGFRAKKHQRRAVESLRRITTAAQHTNGIDDFLEDLDELYEDE